MYARLKASALRRRLPPRSGVKGSPVQIRPSRRFFERFMDQLGTKHAMIVPIWPQWAGQDEARPDVSGFTSTPKITCALPTSAAAGSPQTLGSSA
jgi:hypothetical protein